jgi:hypothetical protein
VAAKAPHGLPKKYAGHPDQIRNRSTLIFRYAIPDPEVCQRCPPRQEEVYRDILTGELLRR